MLKYKQIIVDYLSEILSISIIQMKEYKQNEKEL